MDSDPPIQNADENPTVFVLRRELSEVHLLLDNLSTNPTKSLTAAAPIRPKALKDDWIDRICRMNWPPSGRTPEKRGEDAALLIWAKDYLNTVTSPANGASIAFTLLVTQDDNGRPWSFWSDVRGFFRLGRTGKARAESRGAGRGGTAGREGPGAGDGGGGAPPSDAGGGGKSSGPTRRSLAENAYPGLIHSAAKYRHRVVIFAIFLAAMLGVTIAASFYTAFGNITLAERSTAQGKLDDAIKRVTDLEGGNKAGGGDVNSGADAGVPPPQHAPIATKVEHLCPADPKPTYVSIPAMQACEARDAAQKRVEKTDAILKGWLTWPMFVKANVDTDDTELVAVTLVTILGTTLLPVLYGVLGAASAVVRVLSFKIKASQLTPRDIQLLYQQLLLGIVTGSCISLFVAQPTADHATSPGVIGTVALSASALSFIAGFGVDQVYASLEALIRRVFLIGDAPTPAK